MDQLETYRKIVQQTIDEYADLKPSYGDIEVEKIYDTSRDHYELAYVGWDQHRRIHGPVLHLDIKDGKIWIQHDGTEDGIANDLVRAGIPPERIVLGFHHPDKRKHTSFAVS